MLMTPTERRAPSRTLRHHHGCGRCRRGVAQRRLFVRRRRAGVPACDHHGHRRGPNASRTGHRRAVPHDHGEQGHRDDLWPGRRHGRPRSPVHLRRQPGPADPVRGGRADPRPPASGPLSRMPRRRSRSRSRGPRTAGAWAPPGAPVSSRRARRQPGCRGSRPVSGDVARGVVSWASVSLARLADRLHSLASLRGMAGSYGAR
jgi:hypothetical protein